jgi:YD repeat-containing protein
MTKRLIFLGVLFFKGMFLYAQSTFDMPHIISPSPSAMQFQKYGDYPVGNNTGIPPIDIPIFTIKEGDIEIPISISYHASGVKPSDINGFVGLGWTLNCGGTITRAIIDGIDEMKAYPTTFYTQAQLDNLQDYQRDDILYEWEDYLDTEPDMFSYSFMGNTGKFVLKRDANLTPLLLPYKPIQIKPVVTSQQILTINAIDLQGFKYEFSATESPAISPTAPTRWDLKKMTSPINSSNIIIFAYGNSITDYNKDVSSEFILDDQINDNSELYACNMGPLDVMENYPPQWVHGTGPNNFYQQSFYPSVVSFESGQIKLIKNTGSSTLNQIEIYNKNGVVLKTIKFNYVLKQTDRVLLKDLSFYDANGIFINKYTFNYYNESYGLIPDPYDAGVDYWGYYNGQSADKNTGLMPFWQVGCQIANSFSSFRTGSLDREPNEEAMKIFVLNEIIYPTGGKTAFEFEVNKYKRGQFSFNAGGLRIKSISNFSIFGIAPEIKTYKYGNYTMEDGYGNMAFYPGDKSDYSYSQKYYIINAGNGDGYGSNNAGHWDTYRRSYYFSNPVFNSIPHGSPVTYSNVTEYLGDGQNNKGRTTYIYDNNDPTFEDVNYLNAQYVDFSSYASPIFKKRLKFFQNWTSGNLYFKYFDENRNGSFYTVRLETTEYDFLPGESLRGFYQERFVNYITPCSILSAWRIPHGFDKNLFGNGSEPPRSVYNYADYLIESGERRLKSQTVTEWNKDASNTITTTRNFEYSNNEHVQPTKIIQVSSKNDQLITELKYPHEFAGQAPYDEMVMRHIWSPVIEKIDYKIDVNNNRIPLQSQKTDYLNWGNNIIAPVTIRSQKENDGYETRLRYHGYDDKGNVLSVSKENDFKTSYCWGYNKTYPLASAVNAGSNEIFFDSFEEGTGWDSNLLTFDNSKSHSGKYSGRMDMDGPGEKVCHSATWLSVLLIVPTKYKFSGWIYSNGPSAQVFLFMRRTGETSYFTYVASVITYVTNQWTYVEGEYEVPTDIAQLGIRLDNNGDNGGGSVWFDDIRLHPSAAQMTTYTYDPLIGMTSQTDVNNRTVYYEYDSLGRLSIMRDKDRNILKKYCYNYAGQQTTCIE